jgi:short-subunit dehydrogenase
MERKVSIITGASSGIGKALAFKYAKEGYAVALAARSKAKLDELVEEIKRLGGVAIAIQCDVAIENDCINLINETVANFQRIDVLVNNAGISMRSVFAETSMRVMEQLMQVNFMGCVYCTRHALEHIIKNKGSVIGISSIAGYRGLPGRTGYSASKFALRGFLQSLRLENKKYHIHVMEASPGYTQSNIRREALISDGSKQGETPIDENKVMSAEKVAEIIFKSMLKRKDEVILTTQGKLVVWLSRRVPKFVDYLIYKNVSKEPGSPF